MTTPRRLDELARHVGGRVRGDPARLVRGIATLEEAGEGDLAFLTNPRYRSKARVTSAGAILVGADVEVAEHDLLQVEEPYAALARLLGLFYPMMPHAPGVSPDARIGRDVRMGADVHVGPFAVVGDGSELGDGAAIGAGCVIGERCRIGGATELRPGVVLHAGTQIGSRCLVHSGVVLGGDGFGFATTKGRHRKVPQVGRVVIEDDVEIGANTAVDRAMLGETRIGAGSKIDDLVMVAHGVKIGPDSLLAAQAGLAGSTKLGARATMAGQSGVAGHLELGDGVTIAAKSAVFADLPDGEFVAGVPAVDHRRWKRAQALIKRLPELHREMNRLRERVAALERRLDGED